MIRFADCKIREARQRIAAIDQATAAVLRTIRRAPEGHLALAEAKGELARLASEREAAILQLEELLWLDELPAGEMAQA